jgi:hypothetical protein
MRVESSKTGRLPKVVCMGTLQRSAFGKYIVASHDAGSLFLYIPDEVTESQNEDTNTGELDNRSQI